ncbi:unnamed protein product, partial [Protopolystoma xenopodis]
MTTRWRFPLFHKLVPSCDPFCPPPGTYWYSSSNSPYSGRQKTECAQAVMRSWRFRRSTDVCQFDWAPPSGEHGYMSVGRSVGRPSSESIGAQNRPEND